MIYNSGPIAIGGVGGSGTRVVAALLQKLGRMIGSDLNTPLDNLWFTLLFKRRSVLLDSNETFSKLCDLFWERMGGNGGNCNDARKILDALITDERIQHDREWLLKRVHSWFDEPSTPNVRWGWKEPNTHLVIDRLFELRPDLRYIHILRNPIDMAVSSNQNQLENWGGIFLGRDIKINHRDSLSYNCAVIKRVFKLADEYNGRIFIVDFDQLCRNPEKVSIEISGFVGTPIDTKNKNWFGEMVRRGAPALGRGNEIDHTVFNPVDLDFVSTLGYPLRSNAPARVLSKGF